MASSALQGATGAAKCLGAVVRWERWKHEDMESVVVRCDGRLCAGLALVGRRRGAG
ncbi:MAG: hypothetical protein LZF86_110916 [Nitrospira sp.]|nr:MAG: hypothetical protein LZF86_110916 [Nitrospira sp.]